MNQTGMHGNRTLFLKEDENFRALQTHWSNRSKEKGISTDSDEADAIRALDCSFLSLFEFFKYISGLLQIRTVVPRCRRVEKQCRSGVSLVCMTMTAQ